MIEKCVITLKLTDAIYSSIVTISSKQNGLENFVNTPKFVRYLWTYGIPLFSSPSSLTLIKMDDEISQHLISILKSLSLMLFRASTLPKGEEKLLRSEDVVQFLFKILIHCERLKFNYFFFFQIKLKID